MAGAAALHAHLRTGLATVARCWEITRTDGARLGFTDHDGPLAFGGLTFRAQSGLSARALQQATGLSVDNTEAMGALSDDAISEADIGAGRYDDAEVVCWLVNWTDVSQRKILFRGHIGEIRRGAGAFHAELRGLTEALNRPDGRVFQRPCSAVLGDAACGVDLNADGLQHSGTILHVADARVFDFGPLAAFAADWFARGRLEMLDGAAVGLSEPIKRDRIDGAGRRVIELWQPLRAPVAAGDTARIVAGCDKRFQTCRHKFANARNFRGFPDLPEDDWITTSPRAARRLDGGSRR